MMDVECKTRSLRLHDGVRLDADVYFPRAPGPHPVLLMRQPYGRGIASTVAYAHPRWYAAHGYIVVIQDVRGRGSSEGAFDSFVNETEDARQTLDWAADLPGSSGRIGMYGLSYQGMTQLFAAATRHSALHAVCPAMSPFDVYRDMAYEGGALRLYSALTWAAQLGAEDARRRGDDARYRDLYALGHGPGTDVLIDPADPALRARLAGTHYDAWLDEPADSPYWRDRSPVQALEEGLSVPALHIGGWYNSFLTGTLTAYRSAGPAQHLLVGPWVHLPWTRHAGAVHFGEHACAGVVDRLQLALFDAHLKNRPEGLSRGPVRLFDLGARVWRDFPGWPETTTMRLYPGADGSLAAARRASAEQWLVHDPWRPAPSLGGHLGPAPGMYERGALDERPDVLCYTSAPLQQPLTLAGTVTAVLCCGADLPSFDLSVVLSVVEADGRSYNLTQGYLRAHDTTQRVDLRATCATVRAGQSLRLSVSGADWPAHDLADGSTRVPGDRRATGYRITTLSVRSGDCAWIELSILEGALP